MTHHNLSAEEYTRLLRGDIPWSSVTKPPGPAMCSFYGCPNPKKHGNGLCGSHNKQQYLGKPLTPLRLDSWSDAELEQLRLYYAEHAGGKLNLAEFAKSIGRSKSAVSGKAKKLGLSDVHRKWHKPKPPKYGSMAEYRKRQPEIARQRIKKYGHPRGATGMKHTQENIKLIGEKSKAAWKRTSAKGKRSRTLKMMQTRAANGTLCGNRPHGSWKAGWREIGGIRKYYRSRWEANYARWLEWRKQQGEITAWEHEAETFWFDGVKRGCMSYLPDFRVTELDGTKTYHEVKGWMDKRSITKIKRMKKYHPDVLLTVIKEKEYRGIEKVGKFMVSGWESG